MIKIILLSLSLLTIMSSYGVAADDIMIAERIVLRKWFGGPENISCLAGVGRTPQYFEFQLPYVPVIHPYHPSGHPFRSRKDHGYISVLFAGKWNACYYEDYAKSFATCFEEPKQTFFRMKSFSYDLHYFLVVQTYPWIKDVTPLYRPHYWVFGGDNVPTYSDQPFKRTRTIETQIFSDTGIAFNDKPNSGELVKGEIFVHGGDKDNIGDILSSPNNFSITTIDPENSHVFYTFCHGVEDNRDAITMHVLLNDLDTAKFMELMKRQDRLQGAFQALRELNLIK